MNWGRVGDNMPVVPVYDLTYDPDNNKLVAGTFARSIMTYSLDSVVISSMNTIASAPQINLYPNPVVNSLQIQSNDNFENVFIFNSASRSESKRIKNQKGNKYC